jgi:hypothetical protein
MLFASNDCNDMREGQAINMQRPSDTNLMPAGVGGGLDVTSCIIKCISSSLNLNGVDGVGYYFSLNLVL